eukprot:TRINITY_DN1520_c0_g1_i1.p2 TRINITY_DN1520_c0_g1~~TRINITY_DN1520_c0_g1_i1.p2  ORF type:complete len:179 (+),score=10.99 TRINITY_DN1520_c0_g1_i1:404-940(+)
MVFSLSFVHAAKKNAAMFTAIKTMCSSKKSSNYPIARFLCYSVVKQQDSPVSKSDTGRLIEYIQGREITISKELGKMAPQLREKGWRNAPAVTRPRRLFTKNTGFRQVARQCKEADACPVPEGEGSRFTLATEAPVNGGRNSEKKIAMLELRQKIWLYAGTSRIRENQQEKQPPFQGG